MLIKRNFLECKHVIAKYEFKLTKNQDESTIQSNIHSWLNTLRMNNSIEDFNNRNPELLQSPGQTILYTT